MSRHEVGLDSMSSERPLLRRRDFLALGAVGLLSPLATGEAWAQAASGSGAAVRPLSVGYIDGSEELLNLRRLPRKIRRPLAPAVSAASGASVQEDERAGDSPVVVPATSLFQGDTSLPGRPLWMHVHGLYPPQSLERKLWRALPLAIDLEVLFPSPDPSIPQPLRYWAWSFRRLPGWNASPPVRFQFPLEWDAMPQFVMRVRSAAGEALVLRSKFTIDDEAGQARLRRGVYLFGAQPDAWSQAGRIKDFARWAPAEQASVLVSMDPAPET